MFRLITEKEKTEGFLNLNTFFTPSLKQDETQFNHTSEITIIHNGKEEVKVINSMIDKGASSRQRTSSVAKTSAPLELETPFRLLKFSTDLPNLPSA